MADFEPKVTVKVETKQCENELVRLAAVTGEDIGDILRQEGKLAADLLMSYTPPFKKYGKKGGAKKAGDTRIKIEVGALFLAGSEFKGKGENSIIEKIGKPQKLETKTPWPFFYLKPGSIFHRIEYTRQA